MNEGRYLCQTLYLQAPQIRTLDTFRGGALFDLSQHLSGSLTSYSKGLISVQGPLLFSPSVIFF